MLTWRHPHLPPSPQHTRAERDRNYLRLCTYILLSFLFPTSRSHIVRAGRSRLTLVTGNRGCVRYPTEGNSSNHELTTAMQHLSSRLSATDVSAGIRLDF